MSTATYIQDYIIGGLLGVISLQIALAWENFVKRHNWRGWFIDD